MREKLKENDFRFYSLPLLQKLDKVFFLSLNRIMSVDDTFIRGRL